MTQQPTLAACALLACFLVYGATTARGDTLVEAPLEGAAATPDTFPSRLHTEGRHLKDASGRVVVLRGVNKPGFVGWHMCGIIDTSHKMPGKEKKQHQGLMTTHGEFYPEMEAVVRDLSARLYEIATQGVGVDA